MESQKRRLREAQRGLRGRVAVGDTGWVGFSLKKRMAIAPAKVEMRSMGQVHVEDMLTVLWLLGGETVYARRKMTGHTKLRLSIKKSTENMKAVV